MEKTEQTPNLAELEKLRDDYLNSFRSWYKLCHDAIEYIASLSADHNNNVHNYFSTGIYKALIEIESSNQLAIKSINAPSRLVLRSAREHLFQMNYISSLPQNACLKYCDWYFNNKHHLEIKFLLGKLDNIKRECTEVLDSESIQFLDHHASDIRSHFDLQQAVKSPLPKGRSLLNAAKIKSIISLYLNADFDLPVGWMSMFIEEAIQYWAECELAHSGSMSLYTYMNALRTTQTEQLIEQLHCLKAAEKITVMVNLLACERYGLHNRGIVTEKRMTDLHRIGRHVAFVVKHIPS